MSERIEHGGWQPLGPRDFANLGLEELAYVKPIRVKSGAIAFAVHAADGSELAVFADRDTAFASARQNDYLPADIH